MSIRTKERFSMFLTDILTSGILTSFCHDFWNDYEVSCASLVHFFFIFKFSVFVIFSIETLMMRTAFMDVPISRWEKWLFRYLLVCEKERARESESVCVSVCECGVFKYGLWGW